jgi:hypothetical protein
MASFTDALRLDKFTGVHFKRWQYKADLKELYLTRIRKSSRKPILYLWDAF